MDWKQRKFSKESPSKRDKWRKKDAKEEYLARPEGDDIDESDSSSEVEDDDAEGVTPQIEKDFFKTLSFVKSRDPRIYDKQNKFYESEESSSETEESSSTTQKKKDSKEKPIYLRDYERKIILEKGGQYSEDESEDEGDGDSDEERNKRAESPTYVEEQKQIRESFRTALESSDSEDDLLSTKKKSKKEKEEEESDYKKWLKGETDEAADDKDMGALRDFWTDPKLDEGEKFLRNYILNREYINKEDQESDSSASEEDEEEANYSEEERILEEQDNFERKFNFRFEEPDADFIKRYPRTVSGSVRRKDSSRAEKRQDRKERKEEEKQHKRDELKRVKNVKKQEILDKLDQLKAATGNAKVGFDPDDLEGDFDPEKHDQMMQNVFNEEYDAQEDAGLKPEFGDDMDEENYGDWDEEEYGDEDIGEEGGDYGEEEEDNEPHCDDPDFIMDADYDPSVSKKSAKEKGESSKKKKRKNAGFVDAMKTAKPTFDPDDKSFDEYMEEYYRLDYEDLIGDLPCRFKYRNVMANDFGLSVEEVMAAKDKELNQWVSVKKTSQYRTKEEEIHDIRMFRKRSKNDALKKRIFLSLMDDKSDEDEGGDSPEDDVNAPDQDDVAVSEERFSDDDDHNTLSQKVDTLPPKDDALSPKGKKKKRRKRKLGAGTSANQDDDADFESPEKTGEDEQDQEDKTKDDQDGDTPSLSKKRKKKKGRLGQNTKQEEVTVSSNAEGQSKDQKGKKKHKRGFGETEEELDRDVGTSKVQRTASVQAVPHPEAGKDKGQSSPGKKNRKFPSITSPHRYTDKVGASPRGHGMPPSHTSVKQKVSKHKKGPMWSTDNSKSHHPSQSKGYSSPIKPRYSKEIKKAGGVDLSRSQGKNKLIGTVQSEQANQSSLSPMTDSPGSNKKRRKRRRKKGPNTDPVGTISDARLMAYGVNPKKIKYQLEYQKQKRETRS